MSSSPYQFSPSSGSLCWPSPSSGEGPGTFRAAYGVTPGRSKPLRVFPRAPGAAPRRLPRSASLAVNAAQIKEARKSQGGLAAKSRSAATAALRSASAAPHAASGVMLRPSAPPTVSLQATPSPLRGLSVGSGCLLGAQGPPKSACPARACGVTLRSSISHTACVLFRSSACRCASRSAPFRAASRHSRGSGSPLTWSASAAGQAPPGLGRRRKSPDRPCPRVIFGIE